MTIQSRFRQFDETIKLKRFSENRTLREKRDRVLTRLREGLAAQSHWPRVTFSPFNQGSYEMGTGIKPVAGDYDIDVGVVLNRSIRDVDPLTAKQWVFDAVRHHTSAVRWRGPCITVFYQQRGDYKYHVDLAIYAEDSAGLRYLAVGKQHGHQNAKWLRSDPTELTRLISTQHTGRDGEQFRRVVRYLKRWKDEQFPAQGDAAPTGIALTAAAYRYFRPRFAGFSIDHDDLAAVRSVVDGLVSNASIYSYQRCKITLPVAPENDLFEAMSDQQMKELKQRVANLQNSLDRANRLDEWSAAKTLRSAFGTDFPA